MGSEVLSSEQPVGELVSALDRLIDSKGESVTKAVESIRSTHPTMVRFIEQLSAL